MGKMLSILQSIAPLVLIIAAGYAAGRSGILSGTLRKALSDFCFYFGMPALLIRTIATAPPSDTAPYLVWCGYLVPVFVVWIAATLYAHLSGRSIKEASSLAMASAYGNVLMLGIPLAITQFGPTAATTVAFIVLVHSPILFLAASVHYGLAGMLRPLEINTAALGPGGSKFLVGAAGGQLYGALRETSHDLATNPIIIAILIGLFLRVADVGLDPITRNALSLLGQATLPCVLVAMGLGLSSFEFKGDIGTISIITLLKLVAMPALAWIVSTHLLALAPADVAVITLLSAMPTGANAYAFASRVDSAEASVSGAVALSTIASIATIATVIALLATRSACMTVRETLPGLVSVLNVGPGSAPRVMIVRSTVEFRREQERLKNGDEVENKTWKAFADLATSMGRKAWSLEGPSQRMPPLRKALAIKATTTHQHVSFLAEDALQSKMPL